SGRFSFFFQLGLPWLTPDLLPTLNVLRRTVRQVAQLFGLPPVQSGRNGERRIHPHDALIEVEFGHALQAARGTLFDAHSAAFAVVHKNLINTVRTIRTHNARLRTDQITVVASVTGAAAETAVGLFDGLL